MKSLLVIIGAMFVGANFASGSPNPYMFDNHTWINISGSVEDAGPNGFTLDYGDGEITVEMDDFDPDADGVGLADGNKVKVEGMIDDDTFEVASIEARSVYVESLGTYFYANSSDEEDLVPVAPAFSDITLTRTTITGKVAKVSTASLALKLGASELRVDVSDFQEDPFDEEGSLKISAGDIVAATGSIRHPEAGNWYLEANSLVKIKDNSKRTSEVQKKMEESWTPAGSMNRNVN